MKYLFAEAELFLSAFYKKHYWTINTDVFTYACLYIVADVARFTSAERPRVTESSSIQHTLKAECTFYGIT